MSNHFRGLIFLYGPNLICSENLRLIFNSMCKTATKVAILSILQLKVSIPKFFWYFNTTTLFTLASQFPCKRLTIAHLARALLHVPMHFSSCSSLFHLPQPLHHAISYLFSCYQPILLPQIPHSINNDVYITHYGFCSFFIFFKACVNQ